MKFLKTFFIMQLWCVAFAAVVGVLMVFGHLMRIYPKAVLPLMFFVAMPLALTLMQDNDPLE